MWCGVACVAWRVSTFCFAESPSLRREDRGTRLHVVPSSRSSNCRLPHGVEGVNGVPASLRQLVGLVNPCLPLVARRSHAVVATGRLWLVNEDTPSELTDAVELLGQKVLGGRS